MTDKDANFEYRNEAAKMRTALAAIRTLEAIRRSKLAEFRTGISVLAVTLSIFTVLVSTSSFWNPATVFFLLIIVAILIVVLLVVGVFFFYRGLHGMREIDQRREKLAIDADSLDQMYQDIFNDD